MVSKDYRGAYKEIKFAASNDEDFDGVRSLTLKGSKLKKPQGGYNTIYAYSTSKEFLGDEKAFEPYKQFDDKKALLGLFVGEGKGNKAMLKMRVFQFGKTGPDKNGVSKTAEENRQAIEEHLKGQNIPTYDPNELQQEQERVKRMTALQDKTNNLDETIKGQETKKNQLTKDIETKTEEVEKLNAELGDLESLRTARRNYRVAVAGLLILLAAAGTFIGINVPKLFGDDKAPQKRSSSLR